MATPRPDHPWRKGLHTDRQRRGKTGAVRRSPSARAKTGDADCGREELKAAGIADRETFLRTYRRVGHLRRACELCGIKPFTGYFWLKRSGDNAAASPRPGNEAARRGIAAESEFQRLVPAAVPANSVIRACNPAFDFTVHGLTVDVKYSAIGKDGTWRFHFAARKRMKPDVYVLFFATAESGELADGYRLFIVPHEMFAGRSVMTMRPGHPTHPLNHYELAPDELAAALEDGGTQ